MSELNKAEKKLCRELIQKALQKECGEFIDKTKRYLATSDGLPLDQYLKLYRVWQISKDFHIYFAQLFLKQLIDEY